MPVVGEWQADGPSLPVEFARISKNGRLTLVITPGSGEVPVLWATLGSATLDRAISDLAVREEIRDQNIKYSVGFWSPERQSNHDEAERVGLWAADRGIDGVVWTALKPGRPPDGRTPPTDAEALQHLRTLDEDARALAEEYIRRAPPQIRTAHREAFEREFGWTPI